MQRILGWSLCVFLKAVRGRGGVPKSRNIALQGRCVSLSQVAAFGGYLFVGWTAKFASMCDIWRNGAIAAIHTRQ